MISKVSERINSDKPECPYCKGAGLVYPVLPSGRPDRSQLIFCYCQGAELAGKYMVDENDQCDPSPGGESVDIPVSWIYHRYFCIRFGEPDPGPCGHQERGVSLEEVTQTHIKTEHHPQVDIYRLKEKPMPKLYGGVRL